MNRHRMISSEVGAMLAPGHGALHWIRPVRRRHPFGQLAVMGSGAVLVLLAVIGAFAH
jgi:hypothetical protein